MGYRTLLLGDSNIVRAWQAAQTSRPQLVGMPLQAVSCMDTLASGLSSVTDELDYVIVAILSSMLTEEGSAGDVIGSCTNIISDAVRTIAAAAKKSGRVEVCYFSFLFAISALTILVYVVH